MSWLPHNKENRLLIATLSLIFVVHVLFLLPLFRPGIGHTHDGVLHMARIAAYFQALSDGQFPVRWAGNLNYGYGTPLFIFYYPLPYLVGSLFHALGSSFTTSFKLLLGISFVLAPIFFYLWIRKFTTPLSTLAASLIYGLAPYHFLDLYVRGDVGELFAFMFIPLVFWSIETSSIIPGAIFYALLILSHNAFALLFSPIFFFYALVRFGLDKKVWKSFIITILLGLGLSAFFWLPALAEQKYTHSTLFVGSTYKENFPSLMQLIWSPWGFGTKVNAPGGLSPQIGLFGLLLTIFAVVFYKKKQKLFLFGFMLFILGVFFSVPVSSVFWNRISFLQKFEFPWRFTALSVFGTSILTALVLSVKKLQNLTIPLVFAVILTSISFVRTTGNDTNPDSFYLTYPSSTEFGAASTIWSAGDPSEYPKEPIVLIGGHGSISGLQKRPRSLAFTFNALTDSTILNNTLYFPGWMVTVNGKKMPIQFQDPNHRGLITFSVPKGDHTINISFVDSPVRAISNALSLASVFLWILLILVRKKVAHIFS